MLTLHNRQKAPWQAYPGINEPYGRLFLHDEQQVESVLRIVGEKVILMADA